MKRVGLFAIVIGVFTVLPGAVASAEPLPISELPVGRPGGACIRPIGVNIDSGNGMTCVTVGTGKTRWVDAGGPVTPGVHTQNQPCLPGRDFVTQDGNGRPLRCLTDVADRPVWG